MSRRRKTIANAFVDGANAQYINVYGFKPIVKLSTGRYDLPGEIEKIPLLTSDRTVPLTSVVSLDGTPLAITLIVGTPGTTSVLITALDGTPTDANFGLAITLGGLP